jgi:hypothetical protein
VNVAEQFNVRSLKPGAPGEAQAEKWKAKFVFGQGLGDPGKPIFPATRAGTYDVFISIGQADGTPTIALPMKPDDGQRRYKIGQIQVNPRQ